LKASDRRAHFVTDLFVEELEDGTHRLSQDLVFYSAELRGYFRVPEGSVTDYASIPRAFWLAYPKDGAYKTAAVLHDAAYRRQLETLMGQQVTLVKPLADKLFREAMSINPRVSAHTRELLYRLVRRFGGNSHTGLGTLVSDKGTNGNS
jgi:hypothetical protein